MKPREVVISISLALLIGLFLFCSLAMPQSHRQITERLANFSIGMTREHCERLNGSPAWIIQADKPMNLRGFQPKPDLPISNYVAIWDYQFFCIIAYFDGEERVEAVYVGYT